jgi:hypothetical protein
LKRLGSGERGWPESSYGQGDVLLRKNTTVKLSRPLERERDCEQVTTMTTQDHYSPVSTRIVHTKMKFLPGS